MNEEEAWSKLMESILKGSRIMIEVKDVRISAGDVEVTLDGNLKIGIRLAKQFQK